MPTYEDFERTVAQLFRDAGAHVTHNVDVAGNQLDVLARFHLLGVPFRLAVECKHHTGKVGKTLVNEFAIIIRNLRGADLVDRGLFVAKNGFTEKAGIAAANAPLDLLTVDDLIAHLSSVRNATTLPETGSEAYEMMSAIEDTQYDELRASFWRFLHSASRARKYSPAVEHTRLEDIAQRCFTIASQLGDTHRAAATILSGMLHYDSRQYSIAEATFADAALRASAPEAKPVVSKYSNAAQTAFVRDVKVRGSADSQWRPRVGCPC